MVSARRIVADRSRANHRARERQRSRIVARTIDGKGDGRAAWSTHRVATACCVQPVVGFPSIATIWSPGWIPASPAGPSGETATTTGTPVVASIWTPMPA